MQEMYYFYFLLTGKNFRQENNSKHHHTLQADGYSGFKVQFGDDTHVSYM